MPRDPDRQVHTPDEFVASYTALSGAETSRLRRIVVSLGRRYGLDGEDLKQSAVEAVLDDRRPWPKDVALVAFLTGVMRSFATAEIQRRARSPVLHPVSLSDPDAGVAEPEHGGPTVEQAMIMSEDLRRITAALFERCEKDEAASLILLGLMDGLEGKPLREATGLDVTAFNTKRRWVRRQIDACLAGERNDE